MNRPKDQQAVRELKLILGKNLRPMALLPPTTKNEFKKKEKLFLTKTTNLKCTLQELQEFLAIPIQNDRDVAGIIEALKFTSGQSLKANQKTAYTQGTECTRDTKSKLST